MPFNFLDWSDQQAERFFAEYRAGAAGRFEDFAESVRVSGGPSASVLALDAGGLLDGWGWFVDTYAREEPLTPIADAGFEFKPPFWLTPIDWYCVGREGVYVASGLAAWVLMLLKERFGVYPLQLDLDPRYYPRHQPVLPGGGFPDDAVGSMARRTMDPYYSEYREAGRLWEYYQKVEAACVELLADGSFVEVVPDEPLVMAVPVVNVGADYLEPGEVEIEFDEIIDRARRTRFEELMRESPLLRGVRSSDDREAMYVTIHGGVDDFRAEVARVWSLSAAT